MTTKERKSGRREANACVEYQCEILVKVGDETQHIRKNESWQAPYGTIPVAAPTPEQLMVNAIDKYYKFE